MRWIVSSIKEKEVMKMLVIMKSNLFTAKDLITLMGGTIIPSSNYGNGTTMKIVLDQKSRKKLMKN